MDELMKALAQSIAHAGPEWAALIIVAVLIVTQVVPALKEYKTSRLELERERQLSLSAPASSARPMTPSGSTSATRSAAAPRADGSSWPTTSRSCRSRRTSSSRA